MTSGAWRLSLIGLAAFNGALLLGFIFPALHHPIALAASPLIGLGLVQGIAGWSRRRVLIAVAVVLVLMVPFLISPTYLGRLF